MAVGDDVTVGIDRDDIFIPGLATLAHNVTLRLRPDRLVGIELKVTCVSEWRYRLLRRLARRAEVRDPFKACARWTTFIAGARFRRTRGLPVSAQYPGAGSTGSTHHIWNLALAQNAC